MKELENCRKSNLLNLTIMKHIESQNETDKYYNEVTEKREQQIPLLYSLFVWSIVVLAVFAIIRSFLLKW